MLVGKRWYCGVGIVFENLRRGKGPLGEKENGGGRTKGEFF
jgi:hypothetical protein